MSTTPGIPFALSRSRRPPMVRGCLLAVLAGVLLVSKPIQREVTNFVDFTGRTSAVAAVDIRPRVTGYLLATKNPFKEGAEVKKGDPLFEIDPRPYEAQLKQ